MNASVLIREAREAAGLTQAELAERLGTTQSAVARLESGRSAPTVATLDRVAAALGLRLSVRLERAAGAGPADESSVPARRAGRAPASTAAWYRRHPPPARRFVQTLASVARRAREGEPFMLAAREFLDEFALRPPRLRSAAIRERPPATGDERRDAWLGALAEHLALRHGLRRPEWCVEPDRFLDRVWFPSVVKGFRAIAIARSPAAFRRRGIFIVPESLERV